MKLKYMLCMEIELQQAAVGWLIVPCISNVLQTMKTKICGCTRDITIITYFQDYFQDVIITITDT